MGNFGAPLTSRTNYIVNGKDDCLVFISSKQPEVRAGNYKDRAFCIRTTDGGKTFSLHGWMTPDDLSVRSVMPATVRINARELVSALRRKRRVEEGDTHKDSHWIDVYRSVDDGKTWSFLSKVADTDRGEHNGNPPAMLRLRDGRLCVTYGFRSKPYGMRTKISRDGGKTWGDEILLRDDGASWDYGYPRMVQRPDGKLVVIYFYATAERPAQHIAATIWDPVAK